MAVDSAPAPEHSVEPGAATPGAPSERSSRANAYGGAGAATGAGPSPVQGAISAHSDMLSWLYQPHGPTFDDNVAKFEQSTGAKREHAAYGLTILLSLYLIAGSGAQFVCNIIGFGYPAYASVKAVRSKETTDDTQWLVYWTVFATFSLIDFFAVGIMQYFPLYWLLKAAFLVYLYLPQTRGSIYLYTNYVDPAVTFIDERIVKKNA